MFVSEILFCFIIFFSKREGEGQKWRERKTPKQAPSGKSESQDQMLKLFIVPIL